MNRTFRLAAWPLVCVLVAVAALGSAGPAFAIRAVNPPVDETGKVDVARVLGGVVGGVLGAIVGAHFGVVGIVAGGAVGAFVGQEIVRFFKDRDEEAPVVADKRGLGDTVRDLAHDTGRWTADQATGLGDRVSDLAHWTKDKLTGADASDETTSAPAAAQSDLEALRATYLTATRTLVAALQGSDLKAKAAARAEYEVAQRAYYAARGATLAK